MKVVFPQTSEKKKYRCRVCGYTYDPAKGDILHKICVGVGFLDLPDSWRCPVCKYPKKEFRELK